MILNIIDTINEWSEELKDVMIKVGDNPLFWLAAFFFGLLVFAVTFNTLNKHK